MIRLRVKHSDDPDLALIGAAAVRRGPDLLIVASVTAPKEVVGAAVRELVTAEEWGLIVTLPCAAA